MPTRGAAKPATGLTTPLLILTARATAGDRILGSSTGADDRPSRPFDRDELEARVRALARRAPAPQERDAPAGRLAPHCGRQIDPDSGSTCLHGQPMDLAPREPALPRASRARPGQDMATIQVAQTLELRQTLARQILVETLGRQALPLLLVIAAVAVWVVQRATRPAREISAQPVERSENGRAAIATTRAPRELLPLVGATMSAPARSRVMSAGLAMPSFFVLVLRWHHL